MANGDIKVIVNYCLPADFWLGDFINPKYINGGVVPPGENLFVNGVYSFNTTFDFDKNFNFS